MTMFATKTSVNAARTLTAVLGLAAGASPALAAISYFDGTFNNSDWSLTTFTNTGGAGSTTNGTQITVGGNPTDYRFINNLLNINGVNSLVLGVHLNVTATYDPSMQGAISSIDYSEDSKNFGTPGGGQGTGLAIMQGGNFYVLRVPLLSMPLPAYLN